MGGKTIWSAVGAAVILATSGAIVNGQEGPPIEQLTCDPNPWVTGGFCNQITIFNQQYCQACGIPVIEQPYPGGNTPPPDVPDDDDDEDDDGDSDDGDTTPQ